MSAATNYAAAAVDSAAIVSADNLAGRLAAKVANDTLIATQQTATEPKVDALTSNAWSPEAVARIGALR